MRIDPEKLDSHPWIVDYPQMTIDEYFKRLDEMFNSLGMLIPDKPLNQNIDNKIKERYLGIVELLCDFITTAVEHPDYRSSELLVQVLVEHKSKWLIVLETTLYQYSLDKVT